MIARICTTNIILNQSDGEDGLEEGVTPIFIAAGKGFKEGYECERIIRQADVAPTAAYMLGVRMPAQVEGAVAYQILENQGI